MWMAGCCLYKEITKDSETGEETIASEFNVTTFYGNSSNLNKNQTKEFERRGLERGFNFTKIDIDANLDPFKNTICGGEAPRANMKRGPSDSNNDSRQLKMCKLSSKNQEGKKVSGNQEGKKVSGGLGRKKREVDQCSSCEWCRTWPISVSKQNCHFIH